ncbi:tyrosine--tRNA ligase [Candidatus Acetothermia bacterium]|jgi:tyrosyl-tRNA synthetase|nr:tyrosine--tRNA ligase [Candidatus Acetothermia bacterium]MCI2428759.1 tyrosine--tRNA ligase [Candidatus Acetothermia bacterium]
MHNSIEEAMTIIERGVADLIPRTDLHKKLTRSIERDEPLRIKLGIDPSAPHLTLGHSVPLRKMRDFQRLGHTAVLVVGDFTRLIGDPSGKTSTRPRMSAEQIKQNLATYETQVFKILDPHLTEIRYNSEWLSPLTFADVIEIASKYTVARMLERNDFAQRFAANNPISILEFLYPLAQAYDSVVIRADVELGGTDQKFNLLIGRDIQSAYGQEPQVILTVPLLIGIDGMHSMSQSRGNYIGINEAPGEIFGKVMSIPDELMESYFTYLTDLPYQEVISLHPRQRKQRLAFTLVEMYHGHVAAQRAQEEFDRIFAQRKWPTEVTQVKLDRRLLDEQGMIWVVNLLMATGLIASHSEARRLIDQQGVTINNERITSVDLSIQFTPPLFIKVGKRSFVELI